MATSKAERTETQKPAPWARPRRLARNLLSTPQDWAALRALGHRALDDAMDYMESLRERPAWEHAPAP